MVAAASVEASVESAKTREKLRKLITTHVKNIFNDGFVFMIQ